MNSHAPSQTQDVVAFAGLLEASQLVIFDFDGVIADSEVISLATLQDALRAFGIHMTLDQTRATFLGTSLESIVSYVGQHSTRDKKDFPAHWEAALFARFRADLVPVPYLTTLLELLNRMQLPFCVASSGTFQRIGVALEAMQLSSRFAHVFSAQQVARGKPEPDLFLFAAQQLGIAPEHCLVIEDSPFGVFAAKAAGMQCVGYTGGSHLRALRSAHGDLLMTNGADMILPSYQGLDPSNLAK